MGFSLGTEETMPRLVVITNEELFKTDLEEYQRRAGDYNYTYDLCRRCARSLDLRKLAETTGISLEWAKDTGGSNVLRKDGRPLWDDHPEYGSTDYKCEQCGRELGDADDRDPEGTVTVRS
jgi:hypothetical protein